MAIESADEVLINRNGVTYTQTQGEIMAKIESTDLMLVNRADTTYKVTGEEFIDSVLDTLQVGITFGPNPPACEQNCIVTPVPIGGKGPYTVDSYQWYRSDFEDGSFGYLIPDATSANFYIPIDGEGKYFGCRVSITDSRGTTVMNTAYAEAAKVLAVAPFINEVILTEDNNFTTRYTDETFPITIDAEEAIPGPTISLTAKCEGAIFDSEVISPNIVSQSADQTQLTFAGAGDLDKFPQGTPVKMVLSTGADAIITSTTDTIGSVGLALNNFSTLFIKYEEVDTVLNLSSYAPDIAVYILTIIKGEDGAAGSRNSNSSQNTPGGAGGIGGDLYITRTTTGALGDTLTLNGVNTVGGTKVGTGGAFPSSTSQPAIIGDVSFPGLLITTGANGGGGDTPNWNGNENDRVGEGGGGGGGGFVVAYDSSTDISNGQILELLFGTTTPTGRQGGRGQDNNSGGGGGSGGYGYGGGGGGGGGGKDNGGPGGYGGEASKALQVVLIPEIATTLSFATNNQLENFNSGDVVQESTAGGADVRVVTSNAFDNILSVSGGTWLGSDGSSQSQSGYTQETTASITKQGFGTFDFVTNNVATLTGSNGEWLAGYIMAPVDPVLAEVSRVYLKLAGSSDNPTVTGMASAPQTPFKITTQTPVLTFPGLFASGNPPDVDLKFPSCLSVTVTMENSIGSYEKVSEPVCPINPITTGGTSAIGSVNGTQLTFLDSTNFELVSGKKLTMINLDGTIAKDTFSSSNVTSATIVTTPDYSLTRSGFVNAPTGQRPVVDTKEDFDNLRTTPQSWSSNGSWTGGDGAGSCGMNYDFSSYPLGTADSTWYFNFATNGSMAHREGEVNINNTGWRYMWNQNDQNIGGNAGSSPRGETGTGILTSVNLKFNQGGGVGHAISCSMYYFEINGEVVVGLENYTDIVLTDGTNLGRFVVGANVSQVSGAKGIVRDVDSANNTVRIDNEEGAPAFALNEPLICELTGTGTASTVDEDTNIIQLGNSNGQWVAGYYAAEIDDTLFLNNSTDVAAFGNLKDAMDDYETLVAARVANRNSVIAGLSVSDQALFDDIL